MPAPKSVVKINKNGVQYTSYVDQTNYYLHELTRAALRDVGKFVTKSFREEYYKHFTRRTGDAGRATRYKVWSNSKTKYPRVQIGLTTGRNDGFYAYFQEFGTKRQPKLGLLSKVVNNNIDQIVEIESKYLTALEDEAERLRLVNEEEMEGDADGDE